MHFCEGKKAVLVEIEQTLGRVDPESAERMVRFLEEARTVFIAGTGRSGLMIRSFAMRLAHLGRSVQVVGDVTTRGIGPGDVLLVASGSGETRGILAMAQSAVENGGKVGVITIFPESSLAKLADCQVVIPAPNAQEPAGQSWCLDSAYVEPVRAEPADYPGRHGHDADGETRPDLGADV